MALFLCLLAGMPAVLAQETGEGRNPVWQLGASAALSATDNAQASPNNPRSGVGAEVGVEIRMNLPYRQLRGFADYSLAGMVSHSDNTSYRRRHELHAELSAEVIESHAFLDVSAAYAAQLGSVFASPEQSLLIDNNNRLDTANITWSPALRSRLGDGGRVEVRFTDSTTKVGGSSAGDGHSQAGALYLDSGVRPRSSIWKGQAFAAVYRPAEGRRTTEALVRGDVGWAFDGETVVSVVAGREGNDFDSIRRTYSDLYGLSLDYRPNERTHFFTEVLHRYFGIGHTASLSYRLPRFALIGTSSRTSSRPGLGLADPNAFSYGSAFDVLFLQLSSVEPDAGRRRILVLDLLKVNGIDPAQPVNPRLVTSGVLLVESNSVSATWTGVRNTITLAVSGGSSRRLDSLVSLPVGDQFNTEERIEQQGAQLLWLHRLTPSDDLSVSYALSQADGSLTQRKSRSHTGQLRWSRKIGVRSTLAANMSHQRFEEVISPDYSVSVISCEYSIRF